MDGFNTGYAALAPLGIGVVLLLGAAVGFFPGDWNLTRDAAPVALVGVAAALVGVRLLKNEIAVGTKE